MRHQREEHRQGQAFTCPNCEKTFMRNSNLQRHEKTCNGGTLSKRKLEEPGDNAPEKKQKLSDEEMIAFEVFAHFRCFIFLSHIRYCTTPHHFMRET